MLCPGSPNTHLSNAVEAKASSNLESLNHHALDRPCAFPVIACADAGDDDQRGAGKF